MSHRICSGCGHLDGAHKVGCLEADIVVGIDWGTAERPAVTRVCPECDGLNDSHAATCSRAAEFIMRPEPKVMDPFVPDDPEDPEVQAMVESARGRIDQCVSELTATRDVSRDYIIEPSPHPVALVQSESRPFEWEPAAEAPDGVVVMKHPGASTEHDVAVYFAIRPNALGRALKRFGMSKDLLGGGIAAAVDRYLRECGCAARYRLDVTLSLQEGCQGVTLVKRGGD